MEFEAEVQTQELTEAWVCVMSGNGGGFPSSLQSIHHIAGAEQSPRA
jgi:hypothetical protein